MKTSESSKPERRYYIDWLRIILILTVFAFHIGMIFNPFDWHIKNERQFEVLSPIMSFLHLWRMPLLFLISGIGTRFALGKRNARQYLGERFRRLIIPLIAGIFILVPIQVYFERIGQYDSLWDYYPHMFDGVYPQGNFSWHHLWFIAYLFLISALLTPFLKFMGGNRHRWGQFLIHRAFTRPLGLNLVLIPLILSQVLLKPYFPVETHDVVNDWAFITFNAIFFLAGFVLLTKLQVVEALKHQRSLYLLEAFIASVLWLIAHQTGHLQGTVGLVVSIVAGWSCGMAALGYAVRYLNRDSQVRKLANEAIYPFYLLHQPAIVVFGYYIIHWDIPVAGKALLIAGLSLLASVAVYWFLIRPFDPMRALFGMKKRRKTMNAHAPSLPKRPFKRGVVLEESC
jgi:peptidoglycan/LPS O-acetylase OafA/YrhL